jgi:hypothetical protein
MNAEPGTKVFAEDDAHVNAAKCIGLDHDLSRAEHTSNGSGPLGVTPADDHPRHALGRVRVAQKNDVDAM